VHDPFTQLGVEPLQTLQAVPQWFASVPVLKHELPQTFWPEGHLLQTPAEQIALATHCPGELQDVLHIVVPAHEKFPHEDDDAARHLPAPLHIGAGV